MGTPQYIDIHSQLNFSQFDDDRAEVVARMREHNVWTITVGTSPKESQQAVGLAEAEEGFYATVGTHPTHWQDGFDEELYEKLAQHEKVVSVGECGLDYFHDDSEATRKAQKALFEKHIDLATRHNLPLTLHCRPQKGRMDAYEDVLDILEACNFQPSTPGASGNSHFFVGNIPVAKRFLELGMTVSFDGPITFTDEYNEVVRYVPIDMVHAETDAPFAAPAPYRGTRCEPWHVIEVVKALAQIRGEDEETLRLQLLKNAKRDFGIDISL